MDKQMVLILAGMFARSNMGMELPSLEDVQTAKKHPPRSTNDVVILMCGDFLETEEQLKMFEDEAESWVNILEEDGEEKSRRIHSAHFELYDRA